MMRTQPNVTIVGAGLAGSFMAILLGQRGFNVDIYERRDDLRTPQAVARGPSMNLGLSRRGIAALAELGLIDEVMQQAIPMHGRMIHAADGTCTFQPYGGTSDQAIYAVRRNDINALLVNAAERCPNVRFHFQQRCIDLDKARGVLKFQDEQTQQQQRVTADLIIGADGVFSTVRQLMQRGERANYQQRFLDWGWKEVTIPPGPNGSFLLEKHAFHLWPRGSGMIFAHPNPDGSFCCSLVLPFQGEPSFASLQTEAEVLAFFTSQFNDIVRLTPSLTADFCQKRIVPLVSTHVDPWYYKDRVVLLGDACHGVYPFYAQGMNAAFEGCIALGQCLDHHRGRWELAFAEYQRQRKPNTDALAEMSEQNFVELRDRVRSPLVRGRKQLDLLLNRVFAKAWMPLHGMVTHTTMPYAEALRRSRRQDRRLKQIGLVTTLLALLPFGRALLRRLYSGADQPV